MSFQNPSDPSSSSSSSSSSSPSSPSSPRPLSSYLKLSKEEQWYSRCVAENSYRSLLGWRFTIGGIAIGMTLSAFLPPTLSPLRRLLPFFGFGLAGIGADDYFVRRKCREMEEEFFLSRPPEEKERPTPPKHSQAVEDMIKKKK